MVGCKFGFSRSSSKTARRSSTRRLCRRLVQRVPDEQCVELTHPDIQQAEDAGHMFEGGEHENLLAVDRQISQQFGGFWNNL